MHILKVCKYGTKSSLNTGASVCSILVGGVKHYSGMPFLETPDMYNTVVNIKGI